MMLIGSSQMHTDASYCPLTLQGWTSSPDYQARAPDLTAAKFAEITDLLLERPNLNSSHLFRADILSDTSGKLQTVYQKSTSQGQPDRINASVLGSATSDKVAAIDGVKTAPVHSGPDTVSDLAASLPGLQPPNLVGFKLVRSVIRRLIPRKPKLDRPMSQSCLIYTRNGALHDRASTIVVYLPHAVSLDDIPWYHPGVKAMAYQHTADDYGGSISVHYLLFSPKHDAVPDRLHRTMMSLLQTFIRLSKLDAPTVETGSAAAPSPSARIMTPAALKDTIIPQHVVQDTYTRLKQTYASDLIARWVEKTSPAKHVFEDLAIAAFLIELWRTMYEESEFPGFIDIACGNGVLVYILVKEGFSGRGFDARRRKTWEALCIDEYVEEKLCVPQPFLHVLEQDKVNTASADIGLHDGIFPAGTFIISNHADELTLWTPILATLASAGFDLPFLAIPCCSHSLSGSKKRYYSKDVDMALSGSQQQNVEHEEEDQPASGNLRALKAQKDKAASHSDDKSTYACLTRKAVALAEELDIDIELTLMRIPSTRNIGIVGNRHLRPIVNPDSQVQRIQNLIERECKATGGLEASAQAWIERARKHLEGSGRGKLNLGRNTAKVDHTA